MQQGSSWWCQFTPWSSMASCTIQMHLPTSPSNLWQQSHSKPTSPKTFHPHAQAHGPAQRKHLEQQHVRPLPCQPTTSTAAIAISTTSRSRWHWRPIRRISQALWKHIGRRRVTNGLPATGRYQPSAYEDDKGKDHPPRKNQRTSMPAKRQRRGNTSTTMDNISRISAISPAHDDEEDEPQATPPRTKGLWGALARKIPPTKLPLGKAFCQTVAGNALDDD